MTGEEGFEVTGIDPWFLERILRLTRVASRLEKKKGVELDAVRLLEAKQAGYVSVCDARSVGVAGMRLGAGRARKEDTIDPAVGITVLAKPGDEVEEGTPLAVLEYRHQARLDEALRILEDSWTISEEAPEPTPLILDLIE